MQTRGKFCHISAPINVKFGTGSGPLYRAIHKGTEAVNRELSEMGII